VEKTHCLESDYGSTTVQIVYSRLLPKVNSVLEMRALRGREFGVCNFNTQENQRREEAERNMWSELCVGVLSSAVEPPIYRGRELFEELLRARRQWLKIGQKSSNRSCRVSMF